MFRKRFEYGDRVPYIYSKYAVISEGKLHIVTDLLNHGSPTHSFYRAGTLWSVLVRTSMSRDMTYDALEFTLAQDPSTSFISEE